MSEALYRDYDEIYMNYCRDDTALILVIKILRTELSVSVRACRMYLRIMTCRCVNITNCNCLNVSFT